MHLPHFFSSLNASNFALLSFFLISFTTKHKKLCLSNLFLQQMTSIEILYSYFVSLWQLGVGSVPSPVLSTSFNQFFIWK